VYHTLIVISRRLSRGEMVTPTPSCGKTPPSFRQMETIEMVAER
jgi:hypothetical protein